MKTLTCAGHCRYYSLIKKSYRRRKVLANSYAVISGSGISFEDLDSDSSRNGRWRYHGLTGLGVGAILSAAAYQLHNSDNDMELPVSSDVGLDHKQKTAILRCREILKRKMDEKGIPGLSVAVSIDGKQVWSEGLGYTDIENRVLCTADTRMRIASISKSLTACAIAKLMEQGKLDLDRPVQEYVPSFPIKTFNGEKVTVTTRHLVHNLSGIRHYDKSYIKEKNNGKPNKTTDTSCKGESPKNEQKTDAAYSEFYSAKHYDNITDALEIFKDDPLLHKPGGRYSYTTYGWTLVSAVVEGASGQGYLAYMKNMLNEMGLKNTVPDLTENLVFNRSRHYCKKKDGSLQNCRYVDLSCKWAGGGYLSTVGDLVNFGNILLYSYQQSDGTGYLPQKSVEALWSCAENTECNWDQRGCYGMGWGVTHFRRTPGFCRQQPQYFSQTGGAVGASSVLLILVPQKERESSQQGGLAPATQKIPTLPPMPKGVVVAIICNLTSVGLNSSALEIALELENATL